MQREFGKRTFVRPPPQVSTEPQSFRPTPQPRDPVHMRRAVLAIVLTITIVGGMFLLPRLGQCDGSRGAFGFDWCRLMRATVEGGVRGVAVGRGTAPNGR
jgi:hypothetical protein